MHRSQIRRINITDLNPHLICLLCGGYYIDATTIIECLHSFCKSCIVRYLETNKYCPICDVQVHKTKPLQNIRPDNTLQDIVYKLVPGLFQNEMCRRKEFYSNHPDAKPTNPEDSGEVTEHSHIYSSDESINIALEYSNYGDIGESAIPKRYLRCPVGVTVSHIQKLIRAKFGLSLTHRVDILYRGEILDDDFTLLDIAYIYRWRRKELISLSFHIFESSVKRIKIDYNLLNKEAGLNSQVIAKQSIDDVAKSFQTSKCTETEPHNAVETSNSVSLQKSPDHNSSNKSEVRKWKEVQIQISENGVMSVTGITSESNTELALTNSVAAVQTEVNFNVDTAQDSSVSSESCTVIKEVSRSNSVLPDAKNRNITDVIADTISKQSKLNSSKTFEQSAFQGNIDGNKQETNPRISNACLSSSTLIHHPPSFDVKHLKSQESTKCILGKIDGYPTKECTARETPKMAIVAPTKSVGSPMVTKKHSNSPIGYKTLKTPPKSWNPSISRSSFLPSKSHLYCQSSPKKEQSSNFGETNVTENSGNKVPPLSKPPRFFKARNTPRYLGNPASGVKPIFQVSPTENVSSVPVKQETHPAALGAPKLSNAKIMKIDPKTLGPVVSSSLRCTTPPTLPVISTSAVLKREFPLHGNPAREMSTANKITSSNISLSTGLTTTRTTSSSLNANSIIPNLPSTAAHQLYGNLPAFPGVGHPPPLIRSVSPHLTSAYHPLNMLYHPHQHNRMHSQVTNTLTTPAVQRIPATNSQQKTFSTNNNSITLNNNIIQPKVSSTHMCHYSTSKQSSEISSKLPKVEIGSDVSVNGERRKCELNSNSNTESLGTTEPSADTEIRKESTSLTGNEKKQEIKEVEKNKLCDVSSGHNVSANCDQNFPVCMKGAVRQNIKKKENFHVENFTLEKKNR